MRDRYVEWKRKWDILAKNKKIAILSLLFFIVAIPITITAIYDPLHLFTKAAGPVTPPVTPPVETITPAPTTNPGCTKVTFSESKTAIGVDVTLTGAWNLSVKASPIWQNVTYDTAKSLITLHFNVSTGTISIYLASYSGAPLCQTYIFGMLSPTPSPTPLPPFITIYQPNGGENLIVGQPYTIKWNSSKNFDSVDLQYATDGGFSSSIAKNISNTGSYIWNVNTLYGPGNYKLYIYGYTKGYNTANDASDGSFIISQSSATPTPTPTPPPTPLTTIHVTSPNGGERFEIGQTMHITWDSTRVDTVILDKIDSVGIRSGVSGGIPNTGSFDWIVSVPPTSTDTYYKIAIQGNTNGSSTAVMDTSDNYFYIVKPSPTPTPTPIIVCGTIYSPCCGGSYPRGTCRAGLYCSNVDGGTCLTISKPTPTKTPTPRITPRPTVTPTPRCVWRLPFYPYSCIIAL